MTCGNGPVASALGNISVKKGRKAIFRFKITDLTPRRHRPTVCPEDATLTSRGLDQPEERLDGRAFARTIGPNNRAYAVG